MSVSGWSNADKRGCLLMGELFEFGKGGSLGLPAYKHDEDREVEETALQEVYQFYFDPL